MDNNHLESTYKFVQDCLSLTPVIILGSGHSCAFGIPGMAQLADYLRSEIPKEIAGEDQEAWRLFEERIQTVSLEEALQEVTLSQNCKIRPTSNSNPFLTEHPVQ